MLEGGSDFPVTFDLTFNDSADEFLGTFGYVGKNMQVAVDGNKVAWSETYDLTAMGPPILATHKYIDLVDIEMISKFRSAAGHDYSSDFESCRSMKHYFTALSALDPTSINIYSPTDGKIVSLSEEEFGYRVGIKSSNNTSVVFVLFHVDLNTNYVLGDVVAAGDILGSHIVSQTFSDIAVHIKTSNGMELVSYFDVMPDSLFSEFINRGIVSKNELNNFTR